MISQMTPAGTSPASRARSTAASVWPARTSTPPSRARSGKTWPGWTRSRPSSLQPRRQNALAPLPEHVGFEADLVARLEPTKGPHGERVRYQRDLETLVVEGGDRERDAVNRDRALLDAVADDRLRRI